MDRDIFRRPRHNSTVKIVDHDIFRNYSTVEKCRIVSKIVEMHRVMPHIVEYCGILSNNVKYCWIMSNIVKFSKNVKYCRKMPNIVEWCRILSKHVEYCIIMLNNVESCRKMSNIVEKCRCPVWGTYIGHVFFRGKCITLHHILKLLTCIKNTHRNFGNVYVLKVLTSRYFQYSALLPC